MSRHRATTNAATARVKAAARARSARNALRHGLNIPVSNVSAFAPQIEHLADQIAEAGAPTEVRDRARTVAEAHIDICRVRRMRHQFLERALAEHHEPRQLTKQKFEMLKKWTSPETAFGPIPQLLVTALAYSSTPISEKWSWIVTTYARELTAFDRYERRALSRRARAIELLDAARIFSGVSFSQPLVAFGGTNSTA